VAVLKEVIISGASGNIGKEAARVFLEKGYKPRLLYFSNSEALADFNTPKHAGDLCNSEYIKESLKNVDFSQRIININAAGITIDKLCVKMSDEEFLKVIDVNLKGIFLLSKYILKKQKAGAHIINLSSISGVQGRAGQSAYSAAKGALISFTKSLAVEGGRFNVCANVVLPGFIPSKMSEKLNAKAFSEIEASHVLKRFQTKEECAVFNLDSRIIS
jgi:3-oxoacyl-[acyl-carrier protein] reductase